MPSRTSFLLVPATVAGGLFRNYIRKENKSHRRYKDHPNSPVANIFFYLHIFFNKRNNIYVYYNIYVYIIHVYVYLLQYMYA